MGDEMASNGAKSSETVYRTARAWASSSRAGASIFDPSRHVRTPQASHELVRRMVDAPEGLADLDGRLTSSELAGAR